MIKIERPEGQFYIYVQSPASYIEFCKSVPGHRWMRKERLWRYPATPAVARELYEIFEEEPALQLGPQFKKMIGHARLIKRAQAIKASNNLKPIPLTKTKPWFNQLRAYHYARVLKYCMLAMDMGAGKSKVVVDLVTNLDLLNVLIVCTKPALVSGVWENEFIKHSARRDVGIAPLKGPIKKRTEWAKVVMETRRDLYPIRVFVINYDGVWREPFKSWALDQTWDMVVADESHRIKAPGSKVSMFFAALGLRAKYRMALTGTPMPNSPLDVYGQYRFLDIGIFGSSFYDFREEYAILIPLPGDTGARKVVGFKNQKRLRKKMFHIAYHINTDEIHKLPPETNLTFMGELDKKSQSFYNELDREFIAHIADGTVTLDNALVKIGRLQEITSGYATADKTDPTQKRGRIMPLNQCKADLLLDVLRDIQTHIPLVIFARFIYDLDAIHQVLHAAGWTSLELSGRKHQLPEWQKGQADALVTQIQAGKESVDMTRARYGIYYSLTHSLGDYQQSRKRIRRPGQKNPHTFIHLLIKDTIDEDIMQALEKKQNVVEFIMAIRRSKMQ
jgi:SNF2 family DNA or RNA helicase